MTSDLLTFWKEQGGEKKEIIKVQFRFKHITLRSRNVISYEFGYHAAMWHCAE